MTVKFGRYELLERVSVGGMAEVFRGRVSGAAGFEKIVAIKRILPHLSDDQEFISMFVDEAKLSANLNHSNIGQVFEFGKIENRYFIAMEYIHGKDVRRIQDYFRSFGKSMPVPMAIRIMLEVCSALEYAHGKRDETGRPLGIVHRDVSPQNVLISYEGAVKLIDFGIAKALSRSTKTSTGNLKGKYGYMSPEQVEGADTDGRSDIFASGTVLYELLTGERLFSSDSELGTLELVRKADVPPASKTNAAVPRALDAIVLKALARRVHDRFQKAEEMHEALERFAQTARMIFSNKQLSRWMKSTFASELGDEPKGKEAAPATLGTPAASPAPGGSRSKPVEAEPARSGPRAEPRPAPASRPFSQPRPAPASRPGATPVRPTTLQGQGRSAGRPGEPAANLGPRPHPPGKAPEKSPAGAGVARPTMWGIGSVGREAQAPGRPRLSTPAPAPARKPEAGIPQTPAGMIAFGSDEDENLETRVSGASAELASQMPEAPAPEAAGRVTVRDPGFGAPAAVEPGSPRRLAEAQDGPARKLSEAQLRKTLPDPGPAPGRPASPTPRGWAPAEVPRRETQPGRAPGLGFTPEAMLGDASTDEINDSADTVLQPDFEPKKKGPEPVARPVEVVIPGRGRGVDTMAPTIMPGGFDPAQQARLNQLAPQPALGGAPIDENLDDGPTMIDLGEAKAPVPWGRDPSPRRPISTPVATRPAPVGGRPAPAPAARPVSPARQVTPRPAPRPVSSGGRPPPAVSAGPHANAWVSPSPGQRGQEARPFAPTAEEFDAEPTPVSPESFAMPGRGYPATVAPSAAAPGAVLTGSTMDGEDGLGFVPGTFDDGPTRATLAEELEERVISPEPSDQLLHTSPDDLSVPAESLAGATIHWKFLFIAGGAIVAALLLGGVLQWLRWRTPTVDVGALGAAPGTGQLDVTKVEPEPKKVTVSKEPEPKKVAVSKEPEPKKKVAVSKEPEPKKVAVSKEPEPKKVAVSKEPEPKKVALNIEPKPEPKKKPESKPEPKTVEPKKKPEPKPEPKKVEPKKKPEPKKVEPKKVEPKKVEPKKKPEPKPEPKKKAEPKKLEPKKKAEPKTVEPKKKVESASKLDSKKVGFLAVSSRPWARVHVDGKDSGRNTPIPPGNPLSLKAGTHQIILEVDKQRFPFTVVIVEGQTAKLVKALPVKQ